MSAATGIIAASHYAISPPPYATLPPADFRQLTPPFLSLMPLRH